MTPEEIEKLPKPGYLGDRVRFEEVCQKLDHWVMGGKGSFLDVGAGFGFYKGVAEKLGYKYVGIDTEPRAAHVLMGDAEDLEYQNDSFDVVICVDVLEHLEAPAKAVAEMLRVLKPGGQIIVHVPNKFQTHILFQPEEQADHKRKGFSREELEVLFDVVNGGVESTFGLIECLAWELSYAGIKGFPVIPAKLLEFDYRKFESLGWLVSGVKK